MLLPPRIHILVPLLTALRTTPVPCVLGPRMYGERLLVAPPLPVEKMFLSMSLGGPPVASVAFLLVPVTPCAPVSSLWLDCVWGKGPNVLFCRIPSSSYIFPGQPIASHHSKKKKKNQINFHVCFLPKSASSLRRELISMQSLSPVVTTGPGTPYPG